MMSGMKKRVVVKLDADLVAAMDDLAIPDIKAFAADAVREAVEAELRGRRLTEWLEALVEKFDDRTTPAERAEIKAFWDEFNADRPATGAA